MKSIYTLKTAMMLALMMVGTLGFSQTASVQIVHNSADAAAAVVDIYANDVELLGDVPFRFASSFVDVPAGVDIEIAIAPGTSTSSAEAVYTTTVNLTDGETYIVVADGIVSATGYSPAPAFGLEVFPMAREAASMATNTDVLVHHGSTDAPTVDVAEVGVGAGIIVDDASYPGFAGYLELPTADYELAVQTADNAVTVATYSAPLSTLSLEGSAITVYASGFLDPTMNSDGPAFGLFAVTAAGGAFIELPLAPETPENDEACDATVVPTDGTVGIYSLTNATVADGEIDITPEADGCSTQTGWCAGGESGIDNSVWFQFVAPANAVEINTCEEGNTVDTQIAVYEATDCTDYSTFTLLGANDDIAGGCANGESTFASNLFLEGLTAGNTYWILVDSYNSDQGTDGEFALSVTGLATAQIQIIHNSADAAAAVVDIYINDNLALDDVAFRTATQFLAITADEELSIAVAPGSSTSSADAVGTFPVTFASGETYVIIAEGIVSATGYNPAPPFTLAVFDMGRTEASVPTNTDVLVYHGATDAPTVDVAEVGVGAGIVVDDASFGDFAGYLELATQDYQLAVQTSDNSTTVATYAAPLGTLVLDGAAITVVASGFLDPTMNSDGPAFGLWVALPSGGELVELPTVTSLDEFKSVDVSVYPNPTANMVTVQYATPMTGRLNVIDANGRLVMSEAVSGVNGQVDLSQLPAGTYSLLTIGQDSKAITTIIKN